MCTKCKCIHKSNPELPDLCTACSDPLLEISEAKGKKTRKARLRLSFKLTSQHLPALLNRPGMEDALDAWRFRQVKVGELNMIMDGEVWKTIHGADKKPFFDNSDG